MIHLISGLIAVSPNIPSDSIHQFSTVIENYVPSAIQKGSRFISNLSMDEYDLSFEEDVSLWACCCGGDKGEGESEGGGEGPDG